MEQLYTHHVFVCFSVRVCVCLSVPQRFACQICIENNPNDIKSKFSQIEFRFKVTAASKDKLSFKVDITFNNILIFYISRPQYIHKQIHLKMANYNIISPSSILKHCSQRPNIS